MEIKFQSFPILSALNGYVEKIWLFESSCRLPTNDLKLIVPNGRPLLLLTHKNGALGTMDSRQFSVAENKIAIVGVSDKAAVVDSLADGPTASIGIEFSPFAFYRFFDIPAADLSNNLHFLPDVSGKKAADLERRISACTQPEEKVLLLQSWLFSLLTKKVEDSLFEYCIQQIEATNGDITVSQLEKNTGYSSRWLNIKFKERLGISPKIFSSIIRFQHYYKALILQAPTVATKRSYYNQYYDQAHFIKDFKRFTGMTPTQLLEIENKFGRLFY